MSQTDQIGLREAISIGIGGMVGGGIFAVLGLAVSLAQGGTPIAFLFAGLIALITSYSYVKLSLAFPDSGGTVRFINEGFGKTVFSGGINNLLWVSYIIMLSLYATAFGSYAPNLISITGTTADFHIYASSVVLFATIINFYNAKVVGKIESVAVLVKVIILLGFVGVGAFGLIGNENLSQLNPKHWEKPLQLLTGGMVIFVAYEGFELIANAVPDIKNPKRNVPKAYYYSIGFVVLLYIVIALVTVGSLPFPQIKEAEDYVMAEAAKPMLGQIGFIIITIAALISTFSAINASLYGGSRVSYEIAEDDELPHQLTGKLWNQPIGLLITAIATLLMANFLELESISTAGSMGFLLIFALVNYTGFSKAKNIGASQLFPIIGVLLCGLATIVLAVQQYKEHPMGVLVSISLIGICLLIEWVYKRTEKKK